MATLCVENYLMYWGPVKPALPLIFWPLATTIWGHENSRRQKNCRDKGPESKKAQRLPFSLLGARYSSFRNVTLDADRMVSSSLSAPTDGIEKG
jgi:hypothetical protein